MAKRLSVDLELNTSGYKASLREATSATADYTTAVNVSNNTIKTLNAEVKKAQKEALGLAQAYNSLSDAQKNSAAGEAMQRQLQDAKKYAAELYDVAADTRQEIKNMASDTAGWDAAKEGLDIVKSATLSYAGAIAKLTGDEEGLKTVVANLTIIENGFNTAIKIGNALQRQSALMTGVKRVQSAAAAAAVKAETAATQGATIAQRAFNVVAKANPYVLLASVAIAAAAAIGGYMLATRKANSEDDERIKKQQELAAAQQKNAQTVNDAAATVGAKYLMLKTQWENLTSAQEKQKWIEKNKSAFDELGLSINGVGDAERAFGSMTGQVIAALEARAKAAAAAKIMMEAYEAQLKNELNGSVKNGAYYRKVGKGAEATDEEKRTLGIKTTVTTTSSTTGTSFTSNRELTDSEKLRVNELRRQRALELQKKTREEFNQKTQKTVELYRQITKEEQAAVKAAGGLVKSGNEPTKTTTTTSGGGKSNVKEAKTQLEELEQAVKNLENKRANIDIKAPNAEEVKKDIEEKLEAAKKALADYKIAVGIDPEKSYLDNLKEELKSQTAKLPFIIDPDAIRAAWDTIHQLEQDIEKEEIRIGIKPQKSQLDELKEQLKQAELTLPFMIDPSDVNAIQDEIQAIKDAIEAENIRLGLTIDPKTNINEIMANAFKPEDAKWDFSNLPDEVKTQADAALEQFNRIKDAREQLSKITSPASDASSETKAYAQEQLDILNEQNASLEYQLELWQRTSEIMGENAEKQAKTNKTISQLGDIIGSVGQAFSSLGQATENKDLQTAGIIAQAIANVIAGYATASAQAGGTLGPWGWAAFSIAGLAQVAATVAQIKQMNSGAYAEGGVIGGHSYYGDKLMARVNSGEAILNTRQQQKALELMDHKGAGNQVNAMHNVEFVLYGEDLYGSMKNYTKLHRESI